MSFWNFWAEWICCCWHNSLINGFIYCLKFDIINGIQWNQTNSFVDCSDNSLHFQIYCLHYNQPHVPGSKQTHCICPYTLGWRCIFKIIIHWACQLVKVVVSFIIESTSKVCHITRDKLAKTNGMALWRDIEPFKILFYFPYCIIIIVVNCI